MPRQVVRDARCGVWPGSRVGGVGMSVLFKALQRAEKVRAEGATGSPPRAGASAPSSAEAEDPARQAARGLGAKASARGGRSDGRGPSRGRALVRGLGLGFVLMLATSAGAMVFYSDDIEDLISVLLLGGAPPMAPFSPDPPPGPEPSAAEVAETVPVPAPPVEDAAPTPAVPLATPAPQTTNIADLLAAGRAARGEDLPGADGSGADGSGEAGPAPSATAPNLLASAPNPLASAELTPQAEPEAEPEPVTPPEPRSLEDALADRDRRDIARAVAPPVSVERDAARRAGAPEAVSVSRAAPRTRDTLGTAYRALLRGEANSALASYESVLEDEPRNLAALLGRAAALHKLRRLDEARDAYQRVLALDPTNREALTNLLAIIGAASPNEALRRLEALERSAPGFTPVVAQIGLVYGQLGMNDQAIAYLRRAVNQDAGNLLYRYNLAILLDRAGERQAAVVAYRAVLDTAQAQGRTGSGQDGDAVPLDAIRARLDYLSLNR